MCYWSILFHIHRKIQKWFILTTDLKSKGVSYIDLAKPKSRARIFLSCTSQGHNALPRPGLKPGLSDSEPSALTTGPLNKAMALVCLRYSWPCMLKVASYTVVLSYIQIFLAWWVTTILYNYGATLCELHYDGIGSFFEDTAE